MGEMVVDAAFAYVGSNDITPWLREWGGQVACETLEKTTMRNTGARRYKMGLFTTTLNLSGLSDSDTSDADVWAAFQGRTTRVFTAGNLEVEGSPCLMLQGVKSGLTPNGGPVGQLSTFTIPVQGTDRYGGVRGFFLKEQGAVSSTGAIGTGVQLGAADADQRLFSTLHLLGSPGTSITVVLESDDNSNFTSATTRITFGPLTAVNGYFATPVSGAITDSWYRFRVTACTGSWVVGGAAGIE